MIAYIQGFDNQLVAPYTIQTKIVPPEDVDIAFVKLTSRGKLTLLNGYAWDGVTGVPHWAAHSVKYLKKMLQASGVHDALYRLMNQGVISRDWKRLADTLFYQQILDDGLADMLGGKSVAKFAYYCVKKKGTARPSNRRLIQYAP